MIHTKQVIKYILISLFIAFYNCSGFLEQEPGSQTSINEQLSTKPGVVTALNGIYSNLESNLRSEVLAVYSDLQSGNLTFTPTDTGNNIGQIKVPFTIENAYSFSDISIESNLENFYNKSYDIINQTNLILEYVDVLTDATETEKNQIKAEALTIRAYTHFTLSLLYSQNYGYTSGASHKGIVYNTTTLTSGITYPSRENSANTYSLIITDLQTALTYYSDALLLDGPTYSYFNTISTKALLARVYLSKNDFQNAYDTANDVILNSGTSLISSDNLISEWEKTDTPVSEILLELSVPRGSGGSVGGSLASHFGFTSSSNYSDYVASADLIAIYEDSDLRKQLFLEEQLPTLVDEDLEDASYFFTKKFQDNPGYVVFRLSEMYLIRAEASLGLNNLEDCKTDINIIRSRANASLLENTTGLKTALLLERRKEMCFEGQYFFDLARNQQDIVRGADCISQTCSLNYPSLKFILPIPQSNIELNENLAQNESY
ncbi:RagB/SusD family nutrient uptake outer membrane protein [Polaribacter sp. 11A2H]|uniref:RagB/SusD family nutrient uptake outer membrane protein n=1 Tax=Polaribacter sp. 11A2H TaxID=2687290 RepID=UPI00140916D0|nr:RagB/SusD family nutrient uptake outer membrane protein [Polaribacter sp. 11A2H]